MNYLSVCSGIEAASVAWHQLGFNPIAFSEIEPFPCKVLAHHYPDVPNLGDMTKFKEWPDYANVDVLVGGTPCQSFSVAGLRKGLDDPRGNLMLTYLAIARKYKPRWLVWENVPGVLSSNGGNDFAYLLRGLGECGYGFAYRILDAQYCRTDGHPHAVPQRRRRVFVVGHLGDWHRAAAVLFDSESLSGNSPPSRKARETTPADVESGTFECGAIGALFARDYKGVGNQYVDEGKLVSMCLNAGAMGRCDAESETLLPVFALAGNTIGRQPENGGNGDGHDDSGASYTLTKTDVHGVCFQQNTRDEVRLMNGDGQIAGALAANAGMKQQNYLAYSFDSLSSNSMKSQNPDSGCNQVDVAKCLDTSRGLDPACNQGGMAIAFSTKDDGRGAGEISPTLQNQHTGIGVAQAMQVRRLTPLECERLQGFSDNWTNIPGASDSARYKALGNSKAINVIQLIGQRIKMVDEIE